MKTKIPLALFSILLFISIPFTVLADPLDVSIEVKYSELPALTDQSITVTTNERGIGIVLVIQPAEGTPWADFLEDHEILESYFNQLDPEIQTAITDKIGQKIVSFKIVAFGLGGGSEILRFPDDFNGINGEPSTESTGKYTILFAYISWEGDQIEGQCCCIAEKEFDCDYAHFNVVPEVPFGPIMIMSIMCLGTFGYVKIRKPRKNKIS